MKKTVYYIMCSFCMLFSSCEDFIEIDFPRTQVSAENIYNDPALVDAVLADIYVQMRDHSLFSGGLNGTGVLLGLYTDELQNWNTSNTSYHNFYTNTLIPSETLLLSIWSKNYKIIYQCNSVIEGVTASKTIDEIQKKRLIGEALFVRTLTFFYLTQIFGEIPYPINTDYRINNTLSKQNEAEIKKLLLMDAEETLSLLEGVQSDHLNIRPSQSAVETLLAKLNLYTENWNQAIHFSDKIINNPLFKLEPDVNKVFLKESKSTVWQLKSGLEGQNTNEAQSYIFTAIPPPNRSISKKLWESFESGDLRKSLWIKEIGTDSERFYHSYKYKETQNTTVSKEYSIIFRLEELYYIRLEANLNLGNSQEALTDWNLLRTRYQLPIFNEVPPNWKARLLQERKHEFFCELGHRFFDLKRMESLDVELQQQKSNWKSFHAKWPLPEAELFLNTNLKPQNEGY